MRALADRRLVVDTGYPPPGEAMPLQQIRAAGVEVAPLLRLEAMAGDLIAEGLAFADLIERYDAAVAAARDEGYAGLKSIAAYRSGLAIRRWSSEEAEEALTRQNTAGVTRVQEQALVDFLLLRALPVARRDDLPVQLHAGYGDRDLDLRLVNPLHLRGMLSSEEADGVHFVVLHAAWPYVREGAFLTAVYANVTLDVAPCTSCREQCSAQERGERGAADAWGHAAYLLARRRSRGVLRNAAAFDQRQRNRGEARHWWQSFSLGRSTGAADCHAGSPLRSARPARPRARRSRPARQHLAERQRAPGGTEPMCSGRPAASLEACRRLVVPTESAQRQASSSAACPSGGCTSRHRA